jgi:hypothetical protein
VQARSRVVSVDEVEVHVLESGAPHLEPLQLPTLGDRSAGELGEGLRRLGGGEDDLPSVLAVADLDPSRITATRSASCCASSR